MVDQRTLLTCCPRDCYSTCSLLVEVCDGELLSVRGDAQNRATRGKLCTKGLSYLERQNAEDRLLYPLRRTGERGSGQFERISWDEALDFLASKLVDLKQRYGSQSVLYYSYAGASGIINRYLLGFWAQYGGVSSTYGDLCYPTGCEATRLTYGALKHNAPWDLPNAGLVVLWGKNPAETNTQQMYFINQAVERGVPLVTIDPIRNASSVRSTLHLAPRPGTDAVIALAVGQALIERGAHDLPFLAQNAHGFEDYAARAAEYSLAQAAAICEVPLADLERFVQLLMEYRPASIICGYGMQSYTNSGQAVRAIALLPALLGSVGLPGGGFHFANQQAPALVWPYRPEQPAFTREDISITKLGEDLARADNPPIRMVWVEKGNPLVTNPEVLTIEEAFSQLDTVVVVEQFLTDTARFADLVLPSTTMFEYSNLVMGYWHPYLQLQQQAVEPRGECRNETWIYRELGKRLGFDLRYLPEYNEGILEEVLQASGLPVTLAELRQGPYLAPGVEEIAFADHRFPTPSGKIEFSCPAMRERWGQDPLPCYQPLQEGRDGNSKSGGPYPLQLLTPHSRHRIHSQFNNLPGIKRLNPEPIIEINAQDAKARGIVDGAWVFVFNSRSRLRVKAWVSEGIKLGCVAINHGWWKADGARANELTAARHTDINNGAAFNDVLVEVEPDRGGGGGRRAD